MLVVDVDQLSNVNYEQRDNFQMEIAAVEQANRREQDDFENQVTTFRRVPAIACRCCSIREMGLVVIWKCSGHSERVAVYT